MILNVRYPLLIGCQIFIFTDEIISSKGEPYVSEIFSR